MAKIHENPLTHRVVSVICGLCLIFILLITSVQAVCYWIPGWWSREYAKYDTPSKVNGEMSLDDAVSVTEDMLEYCIGRLDTLDGSTAVIDGAEQPFFTDREKSHLADCRELFGKAIRARAIAILLLAAFAVYLYVHNGRRGAFRLLSKGYLKALAFTAALAVIIGILCAIDFTAVFTEFHHIFFDNDLWILDPAKDNLINIMQEDVFFDAAKWIAGIWLSICALFAAAAVYILRGSSDVSEQ